MTEPEPVEEVQKHQGVVFTDFSDVIFSGVLCDVPIIYTEHSAIAKIKTALLHETDLIEVSPQSPITP